MKKSLSVLFYTYLVGFLCLFFGKISTAHAQNKLLDSLLSITKNNPKQDSNLVKTYMTIAQIYFSQTNNTESVKYYEKTIKLASELKITKHLALGYTYLGYNYFMLGDMPQALQNTQKGLSYAEDSKNDAVIVNSLQILGKVYEGEGKALESKKLYERVLGIQEKKLQKNPKNLQILSQTALAYNNLGNVSAILGKLDDALEYQKKALKIRESIPQEGVNLTFSYNDIAYIYSIRKDFKTANQYYEKARNNIEKLKDSLYTHLIYANLAENYSQLSQYDKAILYGEKAIKIAKNAKSKPVIMQASQILAEAYKVKRDFEKAVFYKDIFIQYSDSVFNEKRLEEITKIEKNYALDKEKKKTELLEKEKIIRETKIEEQFYIIIFSLISAVLLVGIAVFLWRNNQLKQKNNEILLEKNEEINQQNEEIKQIADNLQMANEEITAKNMTITQKNQNILDNITYAQQIQQAILPEKEKINQYIADSFIYFQPKDIVSGDFYFFEHIITPEHIEKSIICAIDCTGHGVSGAFMTILANDLLNNIVLNQRISSPDLILNELHKAIRKSLKQDHTQNRDGMDMTIVTIDHTNHILEFAGAKNPLILIQKQEVQFIKGDRFCIGGEQREAERIFTKHSFPINAETYFYMFSDGFQDQFGGENKTKFLSSRLKDLLTEHHQKPFEIQHSTIENTFEAWKNQTNEPQTDDVLVIGGKVIGSR